MLPWGWALKERALDLIAELSEQIRRHPDALELARTELYVRRIAAEGKVATSMGREGVHSIEDDPGDLREFARLGVRYRLPASGP